MDKILGLAKWLVLPIIVWIYMTGQAINTERANEMDRMQHMLNERAMQTEFVFRELNVKIDELQHQLDGMYHEMDMLRKRD
jgi:hypothetical protein|tara:strand:- start:601 stop:843 length:243 start_codon:yes stop_codon:yes gene_type:complete